MDKDLILRIADGLKRAREAPLEPPADDPDGSRLLTEARLDHARAVRDEAIGRFITAPATPEELAMIADAVGFWLADDSGLDSPTRERLEELRKRLEP